MTSFTLIAEFSHEIPQTVRGDDASDDRWSVKIFTDGSNGTTREITAVGCCRLSRLKRGQTFTLCGQWIDSDRFGRQFKFDSLTETQPISLEAIQRYLKKSLGIGPKKAAAIVGEYGESALDKCRDAPVTVGIKCGIPDEVMRDLAAMLRAGKAMERVTIELDSRPGRPLFSEVHNAMGSGKMESGCGPDDSRESICAARKTGYWISKMRCPVRVTGARPTRNDTSGPLPALLSGER